MAPAGRKASLFFVWKAREQGAGAPPAGRHHTDRLAGIEFGRVVAHMAGAGVERQWWRARGVRLRHLGGQTQMTQDPLNHRRRFAQGDQPSACDKRQPRGLARMARG